MEILSAEFVVSNTKVEKCPQDNLPEYAFIGRSNVGKSSLINMLAKRPKTGYDFLHSGEDFADQSLSDQ